MRADDRAYTLSRYSPGISSVVSTNAMVLIIDLVRSPETSALFYLSYPPLPRDPFITGRLSSSVCIFYPNRRGKDRCARFFALPGDNVLPPPSSAAILRRSGPKYS
jgi:hypothetical protein